MGRALVSIVILTFFFQFVISFSKQHEGYFGTDLLSLNRSQMMRMTPQLTLPSPNFRTTPTGGRVATPKYDFTCNNPNTRRIFSGIGFEDLEPSGPEVKALSLGH
ncbi:hypothetical protein AVEN_147124-1 [Araneus ventricosus]|uniref:Uncharacterized protein n=1 Tax=Araneus ventricosus TaxID=182803 RepID=A0A4Y2GDI8_ARAVE|nr:hypothetical protein AVEN_147124-1 [Araneus ventricosus]